MNRALVLTLIFVLNLAAAASASTITATFEDQGLTANAFSNNAGPSGQFVSGGNSFNNSYDPQWDTWSGWAISTTTDTTIHDWTNQYSAITGSGSGGSATYGVAYTSTFPTADPFHPADSWANLPTGSTPVSIQVTNTTYAYYTMLNGNAYASAFGPGSYFLLDIRGFDGLDGKGSLIGEVDFYLANFIGQNNYIVNIWQTLNLSSLAGAKSLQFGLQSSDNDPTFGMNTPAYFAADNLQLNVVPEPSSLLLLATGLVVLGRKRRCRAIDNV